MRHEPQTWASTMHQHALTRALLTLQLLRLAACAVGPDPSAGPSPASTEGVARRLSLGPEDCTTSGDEDGDGLADCEDADCFVASTCVEVCEGGADEDGDGLVDCVDDDCWSSCNVLVRSHLRGGAMDLSWTKRGPEGGSAYYKGSAKGALRSLSGSVSLITGTDTVACAWTLPSASFTTAFVSYSGSVQRITGEHAAYTAALSGACPLPLTDLVLPPNVGNHVLTSGSHWRTPQVVVYAQERPWYSGQLDLEYQMIVKLDDGYWSEGNGTVPSLNPTTATWIP